MIERSRQAAYVIRFLDSENFPELSYRICPAAIDTAIESECGQEMGHHQKKAASDQRLQYSIDLSVIPSGWNLPGS